MSTQPSVVLESGAYPCGGCGHCHYCTPQTPAVTQDILSVPTVTTLPGSAYMFAVNNGELVKITIDNLKKIL
jgi:hypothetical protein